MDISSGIQASLAGRYASALFDLASENGTVTAVESDLEHFDVAPASFERRPGLWTTGPRVKATTAWIATAMPHEIMVQWNHHTELGSNTFIRKRPVET